MTKTAIAALFLGGLAALAIFGPMLTDRSGGAPVTAPPSAASTDPTSTDPTSTELAVAPPELGPAPGLVDLDGWLQTDATDFSAFDGRVRIVQFWTFSCSNCKATIPHLQEIEANAGPRGLEIIGVHAPEFQSERDPDRIAQAANDLGVTWPIALDTEKTNFRSWQGSRRFWPRTYVIDQNGQIRFDHIGEGAYDELATTVDWLLDNPPSSTLADQ